MKGIPFERGVANRTDGHDGVSLSAKPLQTPTCTVFTLFCDAYNAAYAHAYQTKEQEKRKQNLEIYDIPKGSLVPVLDLLLYNLWYALNLFQI
ncbi:MAG: hypothetical protein WBE68_22550 [Candidatus Nitrosopolaris sp.]